MTSFLATGHSGTIYPVWLPSTQCGWQGEWLGTACGKGVARAKLSASVPGLWPPFRRNHVQRPLRSSCA